MEKQLSLAYFIKKASHSSLLGEAFKITIRNGRLVAFITFIMFSYSSLKGLADHLLLTPVLTNFVANSLLMPKNGTITDSDPTLYTAFLKDLRFILAYHFVAWAFLCLVLVFSVATSVISTYEAYTAKPLSLKEMLQGTRGKLKRPLKTTIWMTLIGLASAALILFTIGVTGIMAEGSLLTYLYWMVLVLAVLYYVYISALWILSLVISVLEENLSGLKAIYQANELMKGKRLKGFVYMIFLILISGAIQMIFSSLESVITTKTAGLVGFVISIPRIWSYCLMKLFAFAVYTLFYHECKKSHEVEENPNLYAPIAAIAEF